MTTKISCLLLAAGLSRRMGATNKLLLKVNGNSFVRRTTEELLKFPFQNIYVVTGHDEQAVAEELESLRTIKVVYNPAYQTGMHSSIRTGILNAMSGKPDGYMICLADQPSFNVSVIQKLAKVFSDGAAENKPQIVFPTYKGEKGHPVFVSAHFVNQILSEPDGDYGCNYLFKRHPESLRPVDVADASVLIDIDTPEQYEKLGQAI